MASSLSPCLFYFSIIMDIYGFIYPVCFNQLQKSFLFTIQVVPSLANRKLLKFDSCVTLAWLCLVSHSSLAFWNNKVPRSGIYHSFKKHCFLRLVLSGFIATVLLVLLGLFSDTAIIYICKFDTGISNSN